jgi:cellulose synthase/poly-beta-1,6-N-acetylglucosamine synthase-like glycosyltransferase
MEIQPPVSCFCLTYGRPQLLEEAIHSFLQQDYAGPKEMIVLNDYADQTLEIDHPEVQVINLPRRFRTVGEKMNAAAALASHDLLFVWDDDDVYLPHRLSFSVANFEPAKGFFKAHQAWFWNDGQLSGPIKSLFHAGSCWSRSRFDALRGYPAEGTGYDLLFEQQLESRFTGSTAAHRVELEEIYYLYRWSGTGSFHMSGFGALKIGQNVGQAETAAYVQQRADSGEIPLGRVVLQPHWKHDYPQLVADRLAAQ